MTVAFGPPTVHTGPLRPCESLEERVFTTARAGLDSVGVVREDVDSVVLAADDIADGRAITTMLHATAAGAYFRDEIRTTNGSLTALALAAARIGSGLSRRVLVASWWLPSATTASVGRSGLDPTDRFLVPAERLIAPREGFATAACLVGTEGELRLDAAAFSQADYRAYVARDGEPDGMLERLGNNLATRAGHFDGPGVLACSNVGNQAVWERFEHAAGLPKTWRRLELDAHHSLADGLMLGALVAAALAPGERAVVAATGVPPFLQAEAAALTRRA